MKNKLILFWIIIAIALGSIFIIYKKPTSLGLDLVGGSRLLLEAQESEAVPKITPDVMDSLQYAIENRVNAMGVGETIVQKIGTKRLLIEIPNIKDTSKAKEFIGQTAQLEFKRPVQNLDGTTTWQSTNLTGKDLKKALVGSNPSNGEWTVELEFNLEGAKKFANLTTELTGKQMAIFFNGEMQSAPRVNEAITGGHAQITGGEGGFEYEEAKEMVDLLNAGALPVGAKIIQEETVGPTLGQDSINKSKVAGFIGVGAVMIFMLIYYRILGLISCFALAIYALVNFAIYKTIPVTLTLTGIAGFVLSIGMAIDANILIFERTKEELKMGRSLYTAINSGFDRAWTSIFDSNVSTILTCIILELQWLKVLLLL